MIRKQNWGVAFITVYAFLTIGLFAPQPLSLSPVEVPAEHFNFKKLSEVLAATAMVLMGFGLILAARFQFLEPYFGGLDRMYKIHKYFGIISIWLILAHFALMPEFGPEEGYGALLGKVSGIGILILILLTVIRKFPYHKWFPTHRLMGVFYIVGIVHTFVAGNMIVEGSLLSVILRAIAFTAAGCYIYKELFRERFANKPFTLEAINPIGLAVELVLSSKSHGLKHDAGQFAFISVKGEDVPAEKHPFTISSGPAESKLRFTIKSLGDYTAKLSGLKVGSNILVDGAFGHFTPNKSGNHQVWVAGGVGVTPFLSSLRDSTNNTQPVDFFYAVSNETEAFFLEEIEQWASESEHRSFHLICSDDGQRLTMDMIESTTTNDISQLDFYLCGPAPLVSAMQSAAKTGGIPADNIHFEEFKIR